MCADDHGEHGKENGAKRGSLRKGIDALRGFSFFLWRHSSNLYYILLELFWDNSWLAVAQNKEVNDMLVGLGRRKFLFMQRNKIIGLGGEGRVVNVVRTRRLGNTMTRRFESDHSAIEASASLTP